MLAVTAVMAVYPIGMARFAYNFLLEPASDTLAEATYDLVTVQVTDVSSVETAVATLRQAYPRTEWHIIQVCGELPVLS